MSVDQLVSPTPGLVAQLTGILTTKRYKYATVFVDQYSRFSYVYMQKTASAKETLEGKKAFELYASKAGVQVQAYHADNGVFRANAWMAACYHQGQSMSFAGVNAHHQNGIAERRIALLQQLTRSNLFHASHRWKGTITPNLWPYAMKMANDAMNATPSMQSAERMTPLQLFTNTIVNANQKHWKPFGCPVYVLNANLQAGKPHHKWEERASVGVYLGRSPQHSRSVALILNPRTGLVNPQFHVKFDPSFRTVAGTKDNGQWLIKAGFVATAGNKYDIQNNNRINKRKPSKRQQGDTRNPRRPWQQNGRQEQLPNKRQRWYDNKTSATTTAAQLPNASSREPPPIREDMDVNECTPPPPNAEQQVEQREVRTRAGRITRPPKWLIESMAAQGEVEGEILCHSAMSQLNDHEWEEGYKTLLAYKASSDPDTMYLHQAMRQKERKQFKQAMESEIKAQYENGNFTIVRRSTIPKGATVIPMVWQMRRKRDIKTRRIKQYKARLNIDGSKTTKGIPYDKTYAPRATWNSIRLLLTLATQHNWCTKQLDYVLAYPQAPLDKELYMKIPKGTHVEGVEHDDDYVLKLERNIYGGKDAGRIWNQYLVNKLVHQVGFTQSKTDECVFYKGQVIYVLYTDDSIIAGPDPKEVASVIQQIKDANLDITEEGDLQDFLGINITRREDGSILLTQPHLIDQILSDLHLESQNVKSKDTPAKSSTLLSRHPTSQPFDQSFQYRSIIGKLNYLEKGSRPDIAYIVHQCARYSANPRKEHGEAIRWLERYLQGTRDKGMILQPIKGKGLEVYVDANFAGDWDPQDPIHRDNARSRHGYAIRYEGCLIQWKSQLQGEIALSSCESEYTGLSYALREAIPIMGIINELTEHGFPMQKAQAKVHCRVFEDSTGAIEMARVHKVRPRTKHLCCKLHHFRDYVNRGEVTIHKIGTELQPADCLTKPLARDLMVRHRKFLMGW